MTRILDQSKIDPSYPGSEHVQNSEGLSDDQDFMKTIREDQHYHDSANDIYIEESSSDYYK